MQLANTHYAPNIKRFIAFLIDLIAFRIIVSAFFWSRGYDDFYFHHRVFGLSLHGPQEIRAEFIFIIYFAIMEASPLQGTLGKIIMGLKVTNENNQRLSIISSFKRNFAKIISSVLLGIGYIMILFDEKKQGLHDKIAGTFVVEK